LQRVGRCKRGSTLVSFKLPQHSFFCHLLVSTILIWPTLEILITSESMPSLSIDTFLISHDRSRYHATGRDMLAYGYKYGEPWGEDRRAIERAFYGVDRRYTSDSGWSYSSARDGRRSHSGSTAGRYRNASNTGDEQSLVDAMKMVKIGGGKSHDKDGNRSASDRRSRSDISASSSTAGRVAARSTDGHHNNMTSQRSYSTGEYEGKGKARAAVPAKVGRPGILRTSSSFQSDDSDLLGRNEWFHERDTLHSRSSSSSGDYPSQLERNRSQSYGSYGHVPFTAPVYDTYHRSQLVLPLYGYDPRSHGHGHSYNHNANYDDGYDGRSEGTTSYPRTSGYAESSYLGSIYEDMPERYDVSSECGSDDYGSCSDFGNYSESDDDYY
jgi:hypothetical protein